MKTTVLVIGKNVERYAVDLEDSDLVYDEVNRAWLNCCFDNQAVVATAIRRRFSELGIFKRALQLLDYNVVLADKAHQFAVRLLLRVNQHYKAIRVGECDDDLWQIPTAAPRAIVLLESAQLSLSALTSLNQYLERFPRVNLVVEYQVALTKTEAGCLLIDRAQLIWLDLISQQTAETESLLNDFRFNQQLLMINHLTGLSLSDHQRTYKLTNGDYLELKPLEWLAIAIKVLDYDFDLEDRLELVARIGQSIINSNQAKIAKQLTSLTHQDPAIELIRGEPDLARKLDLIIRQINQSALRTVDLSGLKLELAKQLLQVRDLSSQSQLVSLSYRQYDNLTRRELPLLGRLQRQLNLAVELETRAHNLVGCERETLIRIVDLDQRLERLAFQRIRAVKVTAEFLLDRSLPSDLMIMANGRELAELACRAMKRGLVPILEIQTVVQANFDRQTGAIALDYLRILRGLEVELRAHQVNPSQVLIWLKMPTGQPLASQSKALIAWIEIVRQQLKRYQLGFSNVNFVADVDWLTYKSLNQAGFDLILNAPAYRMLTEIAMPESDLRIKFSQLLAEIS